MPIYWSEFDWQSFATLATGAMAVFGAYRIARRQVGISETQNAILAKQAALAEMTLRHEMFDRRLEIYEAAKQFLVNVLQHAAPPDREIERQFLLAMSESKLLFRPAVHDALRAMWKQVGEFVALHHTSQAIYSREGHYGEGNPEREGILLTAIHADLENLVDTFGDEMRLSTPGT
jgi:hypothetical protein